MTVFRWSPQDSQRMQQDLADPRNWSPPGVPTAFDLIEAEAAAKDFADMAAISGWIWYPTALA